MWGYDLAEDLIGRNSLDFLHPDYHEKAVFYLTEMFKGNLTGANEYLVVRKDGSRTFFAEINANILKNSINEPIGILYVMRDVTDRKIAENILKDSEEQHRLLLEKDRPGRYPGNTGKQAKLL